MPVTQILQALGSWEVALGEETPDHITNQLGFFGHIAIADGPVDVAAVGDQMLTGARYVGVLRAKDKDTGRQLSGSGMLFWLGDEDGKGEILETEISLTNATLTEAVTAIVGPSLAVTVGTVHSSGGIFTRKFQYMTRREALEIICDAFNVEFRVNGDASVDVGTASQLYTTEATGLSKSPNPGFGVQSFGTSGFGGTDFVESGPRTLIVRKGGGTDMGLAALGGDYTVDESVYDYSTRVVLLGETVTSGGTAGPVISTGAASAVGVPYLNLRGNTVNQTRTISESGTSTASVIARAQLALNRFNRIDRSLKISLEEYETEGRFVVGDNVLVHDPDTGIVNPANEITFRGEVLHPDVVRASGITWSVTQGMTVAFRTQAGVWLDLTPFVTWETGGNELTIGDLPKSLRGTPQDSIIQVRVDGAPTARDTAAPNAPATPIVTNYLGQLRIEYSGLDNAGQPMAEDTARVDVHVSSVSGFTPTEATLVDSVNPFGTQVSYATAPYNLTRYVKLLAIDHDGNVSPPSVQVSGSTTQVVGADVFNGAIGSAKLADLAVITAKIDDLAVNDAKIGNLSVGKLTAGILTADVTVSGRFATALTGARREMNSVGFQAYNSSGSLLINLNGTNNLLTGEVRTALSGTRMEINPGNSQPDQIRMYPSSGGNYAKIETRTFAGSALIDGVAGGVGATGQFGAHPEEGYVRWGDPTSVNPYSFVVARQTEAQVSGPIVNFTADERFSASGTRRMDFYRIDSAGSQVTASVLRLLWNAGGYPWLAGTGADCGIVFQSSGKVGVVNNAGSAATIQCLTVEQSSSATVKDGVQDIAAVIDPLAVIRAAPSKKWHYVSERIGQPNPPTRFGPMAEELPALLRRQTTGPNGVEVPGIDLGSLIGVLWGAVAMLDDRLGRLERKP